MNELSQNLAEVENNATVTREALIGKIVGFVTDAGYEIVELNDQKPWGGYIRIANDQADRFVGEFFPGLTPDEARLGVDGAVLSPKFLIFAPSHRISWQYHDRRAERWAFLTEGLYWRNATNDEVEPTAVKPGDVVQFQQGERHRGGANSDKYTIVAEIWQHVKPEMLSDEDDIVRVADDYNR